MTMPILYHSDDFHFLDILQTDSLIQMLQTETYIHKCLTKPNYLKGIAEQ